VQVAGRVVRFRAKPEIEPHLPLFCERSEQKNLIARIAEEIVNVIVSINPLYIFNMNQKHESAIISYSSQESIDARYELFEIMKNYPATVEETERSLGLFIRGSLLARIFAIREMYEKIVSLPGVIIDLGTWRGQTAVVCENLRAIFEPLHLNRRIVAFDTFTGYKGFSDKDKSTELHKDGTYNTGDDYADFLNHLLILHEKNNALGHNFGKHKVIKGDCLITLPQYFKDFPNEIVSLAFFDVNAYTPTWESFQLIYEKLVPNGIIAFWQLTRDVVPAEGKVYSDNILSNIVKYKHEVYRSQFYPGLCFLIKK
jgi:Macrocin-O-methyltransferase (TylF)